MDTQIQDLGALAPIAQHLGAVGTGLVVALVLVFRLLKSWIEYKRARDAEQNKTPSSEELDALLELVTENEVEDEKEERAILDSVHTLSEEVRDLRDAQCELRREMKRIQHMIADHACQSDANSDTHELDP